MDNSTGSATVFNADTNTILGTVSGPPQLSGDCSITADGTKGFFTSFNSSVTAVDLTTTPPTLAGAPNPIPIANPGEDTALSPDGKFIYTLAVVMTAATKAECYVNGVKSCEIASNIPSSGGRVSGPMIDILKSAGTTARLVAVDRTRVSVDLTGARTS